MESHFGAVNLPSLPTVSYVHLKVIPKCTNLQLLAITFESSLGSCICQAARKTIRAYPASKAPSQTKHKGLKGHSSSCGEMFVDVFWHASTALKGSDLPPAPRDSGWAGIPDMHCFSVFLSLPSEIMYSQNAPFFAEIVKNLKACKWLLWKFLLLFYFPGYHKAKSLSWNY